MTGSSAGYRPGELVTISRSLWADTVDALHSGDPSDLQSVLQRLLAVVPTGSDNGPSETSDQHQGDQAGPSPEKADES